MMLSNLKTLKNNILQRFSLSEIGLWLLIPLASLTSHTWLPLPPVMLLLFGAIVVWAVQIIKNQETGSLENRPGEFQQGITLFICFSAYLFISQYFINGAFRHYMGAILAPLYFVLVLVFAPKTNPDFIKKSGSKFIRYTLIIFCIEAVIRYSVNIWYIAQYPEFFEFNFYLFKPNGPIYGSSNATAAHLVVLLFFMFWWSRTQKKLPKKQFILVLILLVLTFSRASVLSVFGGLFYFAFFRNASWKKSLYVLFSLGIASIVSLVVLQSIVFDDSFQSKFIILEEALKYLQNASLKNLLFGLGFWESGKIMSYYAHNYFLLFLMESGIVGLLLLCSTLFFLIKKTNGAAMIVILPFIIQTAAESNTFLPYFYIVMALMIVLNKNGTECEVRGARCEVRGTGYGVSDTGENPLPETRHPSPVAIPKKIHYFWMSENPVYPEHIQRCVNSWHKHLPDFEIVLWNKENFDIEKIAWTKEACEHKKYAFIADYVRLHALYTQGGIYLDSDVEVLKNFSPILHHPSFMSYDAGGDLESAIIGAQPQTEWIKKCLDYYENRHFVKADKTLDMMPIPIIIGNILKKNYNLHYHHNQIHTYEDAALTLFPSTYFSPKHIYTGAIKTTPETYCIHHFDASWVNKNFKYKTKVILHKLLITIFGDALYRKVRFGIRALRR